MVSLSAVHECYALDVRQYWYCGGGSSVGCFFVFLQPEGRFTTPILHSERLHAFSLSSLKVLTLAAHLICPIHEFRGRPAVSFPYHMYSTE